MTLRFFDTPERYGFYFLVNEEWLFGGSTKKEAIASAKEYFN